MDSIHASILEHLMVYELSEAIPHFHNQFKKVTLHISGFNDSFLPAPFKRAIIVCSNFTSFKEGILSLGCE